jgi:lycopene cyclase domain-containing protein
MFGQYSYLVWMLIFTLPPIGVMWICRFRFLWANRRIVALTTLTGVLFQCVADPIAEQWHAWFFNSDKILGVWVGDFPIENIIFFILAPLAISSAMLILIRQNDTTTKAVTGA